MIGSRLGKHDIIFLGNPHKSSKTLRIRRGDLGLEMVCHKTVSAEESPCEAQSDRQSAYLGRLSHFLRLDAALRRKTRTSVSRFQSDSTKTWLDSSGFLEP